MIFGIVMALTIFVATLLSSSYIFISETFGQGVLSCVSSDTGTANSTKVEEKSSQFTTGNSSLQNDFDNWEVVTGTWNNTFPVLEGGAGYNVTDSAENIIINPATYENISEIETTFKVNEIHPNLSSYVYIIYSYSDPDNFKLAGVHGADNETFVRYVDIANGCLTTEPSYISTGLNWEPNTTFTLSLSSEDGIQGLKLNGTQFAGNNDTNIDGVTGLYYGRINDIEFYNFSINHPFLTSDSQLILLEGNSLPTDNFIHIYDSSPYEIIQGHISAKLPCDEDRNTDVQVLLGKFDELQPVTLQFMDELLNDDGLCRYDTDIKSGKDKSITDVVILNNSTEDIDFPETSSVIVMVNKISKLG